MLETIDSPYPESLGIHALNVPKTLLSDMDSNDLDDVPLARLLKKTTVHAVPVEIPTTPFVSVHSQKSSSTKGVFVPTPGIHHTSNVQPRPSIPYKPNVAHAFVPVVINSFLGNVVDLDYFSLSPSTKVLASVLSGGILSSWHVNGIPAVALSVKYAILHKIGIAN